MILHFFRTLVFSGLILFPGFGALALVACPPALKIVSSDPAPGAVRVAVDGKIVILWDKTGLESLTEGLRDLKPSLDSINIAGGRYGMGTLLTTEWGVGGTVEWKENQEIITPEKPLEPGTQYRVWTYLYMTIRNDQVEPCPKIGAEIVFTTAGNSPADGNPVREIDLSGLYEGDDRGIGHLHGTIKTLQKTLHLVTLREETLGTLTWVAYEGTPILLGGEMVPFDRLKAGDVIDVTFSGGRVGLIQVVAP
jgi:hypothetical protein